MKKLFTILTVLAPSGCAVSSNEAYVAAHNAARDRSVIEAQSRADADKQLALAVASVAKGCESDACRMGLAMLTFSNMKSTVNSVAQSVAPVIQAPVNEALEWAKVIVNGATGLYGLRVNGAISLVNATRGAADVDVTKEGLSSLDIYRNNQQ